MSLHNNTVPQVLYNTPDPHSQPSELYKINGTVLATATDPVKCWVIHEEHGVWDEATKAFENRATTLLPNEPHTASHLTTFTMKSRSRSWCAFEAGSSIRWSGTPTSRRSFASTKLHKTERGNGICSSKEDYMAVPTIHNQMRNLRHGNQHQFRLPLEICTTTAKNTRMHCSHG